jgi:hypothetical protein
MIYLLSAVREETSSPMKHVMEKRKKNKELIYNALVNK